MNSGTRAIPSRISRRFASGRLEWRRAAADPEFWDRHWEDSIKPELYRDAEKGGLGWIEEPVRDYMPKGGRILEAGCGTAAIVVAMRRRGYDCEGVEWGSRTVAAVRRLHPDLPIVRGDVTALSVPDGHYAGYISLGVMEHREAGPEPFLLEARRVSSASGVALISVPCMNLPRRLNSILGLYRGDPSGLEFYQYAFSSKEFAQLLRNAGFDVLDRRGYDPWKGLKDEWPWAMGLFSIPYFGPRLASRFRRWGWTRNLFGHMMLFICRPRTDPM